MLVDWHKTTTDSRYTESSIIYTDSTSNTSPNHPSMTQHMDLKCTRYAPAMDRYTSLLQKAGTRCICMIISYEYQNYPLPLLLVRMCYDMFISYEQTSTGPLLTFVHSYSREAFTRYFQDHRYVVILRSIVQCYNYCNVTYVCEMACVYCVGVPITFCAYHVHKKILSTFSFFLLSCCNIFVYAVTLHSVIY